MFKMNKGAWVLVIGSLLACSGCTSTNRIVGREGVHAGDWYGELGITGHVNQVTVKSGSRLDKLSIIGDLNKVFVEDRVVLAKVEVWGENNEISVPEWLIVRDYRVGKNNRIVRRTQRGTIDVDSPDAELIEGQEPGTVRYDVVPTQGTPTRTPTGTSRVGVQPATPPPPPNQRPDGSTDEILEIQPADQRQPLEPGVHNPGQSSNQQNPRGGSGE
jgi:hypothetical protein